MIEYTNLMSILGIGFLFSALIVAKLKDNKHLNLLMFIIIAYLITLGVKII